ncbi:MAG: DUF2309 domain-containing protein [Hyphomicrobiales bacterium]|nr:DUF2309 domain-containing protein [Hyphomicrobiales bacterium]
MTIQPPMPAFELSHVTVAADRAARAIPPAWPLASSVAVNPYLGQANASLADTGARLARVAGLPVTLPRAHYAARIASGAISEADLAGALAAAPPALRPASIAALVELAKQPARSADALPTVADLAAEASGIDWPAIIAERFGAWAASHFDEGQALWSAPQGKSVYAAWRAAAIHDLTPEVLGLRGFAAHVAQSPDDAMDAIARAAERLGIQPGGFDTTFHQLLMTLGGWPQYARYRLWQAELDGLTDSAVTDMLAIRLVWEEALFGLDGPRIAGAWQAACAAHAMPVAACAAMIADEILQEAAERAAQRSLAATLAGPAPGDGYGRPSLQAAFCIDVRSEVFRRALEAVDPSIRTLGFAGFFGITASHRRFASDTAELRLPVLLKPNVFTCSGGPEDAPSDQAARLTVRARRAWGRFKLAAVSSFAFVEATGPVYAAKLVRDTLGLTANATPDDRAPRLNPVLDLGARTEAAEAVLRAMSLTEGFARLVILAGHGTNVVNNPHASALHCGACGGYSGEVNARLLAALLNDREVRAGLAPKGIAIPEDTLFVGALHDTTTDDVLLYAADHAADGHGDDLRQARDWLARAGTLTRAERALRLPRAGGEADVSPRSRDWAETRPEWALAGCRAFIAAPRLRTAGRSLAGQAFLHDYDWAKDQGFGVLELIMTAPVVVASWISLQYYASTVAPGFFGAGNKLLHNVVGGIGVVEGNGGSLRTGLPWQSVHDGEAFAHEPLRLTVCIEAPIEAMTGILRHHEGVRALFDNRWLHLFALDEAGQMAMRYAGDLAWEPYGAPVVLN